jgi:hypothetical protein
MTEFDRKIAGVVAINYYIFGRLMQRIPLFWDVKFRHRVIGFQCFEGTYCLHQALKERSRVSSKSLDLLTSDTALYPASTDSLVTPPRKHLKFAFVICSYGHNLHY